MCFFVKKTIIRSMFATSPFQRAPINNDSNIFVQQKNMSMFNYQFYLLISPKIFNRPSSVSPTHPSPYSPSLSLPFLPLPPFSTQDLLPSLQLYQNYMQAQSKVPESPLSTHRSESDSSSPAGRSYLQEPLRRFTRSNSNSRSKSREDRKEDISSRFFVKNTKQHTPSPNNTLQPPINRFVRINPQSNGKRELTPAKQRKQGEGRIQVAEGTSMGEGVQRELQWLKLERKCQLTEAENLRLIKINKDLQLQMADMQEKMAEIENQRKFYKEKICTYEQGQIKQPKERTNNLMKLKREIAKQKVIDNAPPTQHLKHQLETAQTQLQFLKDALQRSQNLRKQAQKMAQNQRTQRQRFLQQMVQQLKLQASERGELLEKMKIQLNIYKIRQSKQEEKAEMAKCEELQALKRKYGNVLKKYHEASQELAAYKRKEERANMITVRKERRSVDNSLSLSP